MLLTLSAGVEQPGPHLTALMTHSCTSPLIAESLSPTTHTCVDREQQQTSEATGGALGGLGMGSLGMAGGMPGGLGGMVNMNMASMPGTYFLAESLEFRIKRFNSFSFRRHRMASTLPMDNIVSA